MTGYEIAQAVLTVISLGYRVEAMLSQLAAMKAAGKTEDEVLEYFRKLAEKGIADAQKSIDDSA